METCDESRFDIGAAGPCLLRASGLEKSYRGPEGNSTVVFRGLSFEIYEGEIAAIVGPNGCGKTTLLLLLAGLLEPDKGVVNIRGKPPAEWTIGLVFQNYRESLLPWRTVKSNIWFALESCGVPRRERERAVENFVSNLRLDLPLNRYPYQLSGGQQQMVSILRAMIQAPEILLMDEPFGSLDYPTRLAMYDAVQHVLAGRRQTVVLVSHELDEAVLLADRVFVLSARPARIIAEVRVPLSRPRTRETALTEEFLKIKREVFRVFPAGSLCEREATL